MNDITALMATMKAAAELIAPGYKRNWIVSHDDETCWVGANDDDGNLTPFIEVSIGDWSDNKTDNERLAAFIALANPANVLALVAALEKREELRASANRVVNQQDIELQELRQRNAELVEALEKAQQHEQEWKSLCEAAAVDLDDWCEIDDKSRGLICKFADAVITRNERITSLESRTVTVKLPAEYLNADGSVNADMANTCPVVSAYREAHRAAGIQVIEGEGQ
ncbi:ead/Ea22-like family protein [Kluyvera intermedia]|uniref:ead/Ea22-like family protein n=1 Tax=Kluyvera intermedia TaxID=61648 RepID=UPI0039F47DF9